MIKNMKGGAILIGGDGKDDLTGANGDDLILGGAGDDTFNSSKGKDVYFGGDGNDTFLITDGPTDPNGADNKYKGGNFFFGGKDSGGEGQGNTDLADYSALDKGATVHWDKTWGEKQRAEVTITGAAVDKLYGVEEILATKGADIYTPSFFASIAEWFASQTSNGSGKVTIEVANDNAPLILERAG